MLKRISIRKVAFSAFVLTMIFLLASVATAQASGEPQQGAINTSRSNLKNTSRLDGRIDTLKVELAARLGGLQGQLNTLRQVQIRMVNSISAFCRRGNTS